MTKTTLDKFIYLGVLPNVEFEAPALDKNTELDPDWISGFITGEGSFTYFTRTRKSSAGNTVKDYTLVMEVSQLSKDWFILNSIKDFFSTGKVYTETRGITKFRLTDKKEIIRSIIPYFNNYPLEGRKALQYAIWIKIVNILETEQKRTVERDTKIDNLIKELSDL